VNYLNTYFMHLLDIIQTFIWAGVECIIMHNFFYLYDMSTGNGLKFLQGKPKKKDLKNYKKLAGF